MKEIISLDPKDLAEKQERSSFKRGVRDCMGSIFCLENRMSTQISSVCFSELQMKMHISHKNYVVLPLQFHEQNGVVAGVSAADSFPSNGLPEAIISVYKPMAVRFLRPDRKRFSKSLLKETIERLRSELRTIINNEIGLRYCENPYADLELLKKLVPKPISNHAIRYANNHNPQIEFLDMLDNIDLCNFCYSYGHNERATTEQFKFILEYVDSRYQSAIIEFACGYAEREQVDEELVRQIIRHPSFDMAEVMSYLRISSKPNKEFLEQIAKWEAFL